jgi:hypothetical protein
VDSSKAARSMGPFRLVGKGFGKPSAHRLDDPGKSSRWSILGLRRVDADASGITCDGRRLFAVVRGPYFHYPELPA